jgi:POTRA domain, FtsQ-type
MSTVDNSAVTAPGRSWRNIRQEVTPLAMSRKGRNRRRLEWAKVTALAVLIGFLAWIGYVVVHSWDTNRAALATAVDSVPVREVALITDGVLNHKWVTETLVLPKSASLMALDLGALRTQLLGNGQVRGAVLTRNFPDTLVVTLQERTPVARIQAGDATGQTKQLLVARDGVVYDGLNYDRQMLAGLPWLDGVRLLKNSAGYAPITGMADIAALLSTAQLQAPHLYRTWLVVSLARMAATDEIVVKSQDIPEIVFTRKRDFFKQIAQLDYVVDAAHALTAPAFQSVNLVFEGQVPVKMLNSPDELARMPQPDFSVQPSQRKSKRDL